VHFIKNSEEVDPSIVCVVCLLVPLPRANQSRALHGKNDKLGIRSVLKTFFLNSSYVCLVAVSCASTQSEECTQLTTGQFNAIMYSVASSALKFEQYTILQVGNS
jgi:hypothetical protein